MTSGVDTPSNWRRVCNVRRVQRRNRRDMVVYLPRLEYDALRFLSLTSNIYQRNYRFLGGKYAKPLIKGEQSSVTLWHLVGRYFRLRADCCYFFGHHQLRPDCPIGSRPRSGLVSGQTGRAEDRKNSHGCSFRLVDGPDWFAHPLPSRPDSHPCKCRCYTPIRSTICKFTSPTYHLHEFGYNCRFPGKLRLPHRVGSSPRPGRRSRWRHDGQESLAATFRD